MVNRWKVQGHWKGTAVKDFHDELCSARLISPIEGGGGVQSMFGLEESVADEGISGGKETG